MDELLNIYTEEEIACRNDMPEIWYFENGKNHRYYPDIYIPRDNLLIEVKSEWTYRGKEEWYFTNLLKKQACIDAGYNYQLMLYDGNGKLLNKK